MIRPAGPTDLRKVREIFLEYAAWVGDHICFASFEAEVNALPGAYAPPGGNLLLAEVGNEQPADYQAGCAAFRRLTPEIAGMKRLYVRPAWRGHGLGHALATHLVAAVRDAGDKALRLDTLPRMETALAMYQGMGFREIAAYGNNPDGALCFELSLQPPPAKA